MTEYDFVQMHKAVMDSVITKRSFQEIIGMLKLSTFARRSVVHPVVIPNVHDLPEVVLPEPTTSKRQVKSKITAKGKGKGRGKKSQKKEEEVQPVLPKVVETVEMLPTENLTISTQTDSDFEDFLRMTKRELDEYEQYKQQQIYQEYLVTHIFEEEFDDYDEADGSV